MLEASCSTPKVRFSNRSIMGGEDLMASCTEPHARKLGRGLSDDDEGVDAASAVVDAADDVGGTSYGVMMMLILRVVVVVVVITPKSC